MSNLLVINHIIHQNIYFGEYIILIKQKMASLKIKYRHSSIEGKAGTLFYQVIHNRVARQINSGYKIYPDEWDIFNSQIIIPAKTGENSFFLYCMHGIFTGSVSGILTKIAIIVQHPLIFILLQVIIISGAIVVLCLFSKLVKNITPTAYSILSGGR